MGSSWRTRSAQRCRGCTRWRRYLRPCRSRTGRRKSVGYPPGISRGRRTYKTPHCPTWNTSRRRSLGTGSCRTCSGLGRGIYRTYRPCSRKEWPRRHTRGMMAGRSSAGRCSCRIEYTRWLRSQNNCRNRSSGTESYRRNACTSQRRIGYTANSPFRLQSSRRCTRCKTSD